MFSGEAPLAFVQLLRKCRDHHNTCEFLSTLLAHLAADCHGECLHCVVDSVVLFLGVLERVQHAWVLRLAYLQRAKKAGWLITFEAAWSVHFCGRLWNGSAVGGTDVTSGERYRNECRCDRWGFQRTPESALARRSAGFGDPLSANDSRAISSAVSVVV
jgi:uncharacterized membrane protein YecN with MAPEG domain